MLENLKINIYADGADLASFEKYRDLEYIKGFTTNPTLMKKAGITDYKGFALNVLKIVKDKSVSFEVFADDISEMEKQAKEIASWGENIAVKIPITNTKNQSTAKLIGRLSDFGIKCNVTAIFNQNQWEEIRNVINKNTPIIISIFAGRIADTGIDPINIMSNAINSFSQYKNVEILWASPRELLNLFHADKCGCHIITMPDELINKFSLINKSLNDFSLETVKMFYDDAFKAGFKINF